jgi:hypothetical protein
LGVAFTPTGRCAIHIKNAAIAKLMYFKYPKMFNKKDVVFFVIEEPKNFSGDVCSIFSIGSYSIK